MGQMGRMGARAARAATKLALAASVTDLMYMFKPGATYSLATGGDLVDTPSNVNLVANGGFDENADGWDPYVGEPNVILSSVDGKLRITIAGGDPRGRASQAIATEINKRYKCSGLVSQGTSGYFPQFKVGTGLGGGNILQGDLTVDGEFDFEFTATTTTTYITLQNNDDGDGEYVEFDNISVKDAGGESVGAVLDQSSMAGQSPQAWLAGQTNLVDPDNWTSAWIDNGDGSFTSTDVGQIISQPILSPNTYHIATAEITGGVSCKLGTDDYAAITDRLIRQSNSSEDRVIFRSLEAGATIGNIAVKALTPLATQAVLADRPTYIKDGNTHLARFNGSNQELQIPNIGQTYVCMAVRTEDAFACLMYGDDGVASNEYVGAFRDFTGPHSAALAGSPTAYINGVTVGSTQADLFAVISTGEWVIVEFVGMDLSSFGDYIYLFGATSFEAEIDAAFEAYSVATPTNAERAIIRNAAQAAAEGRL